MKAPPVIIVQLIHIAGPRKGEIQEFQEDLISIGRLSSCQVRFPAEDSNLSRKHAEIRREGNKFKLIDQSANGTFVNGKRVREVYLKDGDVLAFTEGGPKVSFLTQLKEGRAEPEQPRPPQTSPRIEAEEAPEKIIVRREGREVIRKEPPEPVNLAPAQIAVETAKAPLVIQYGPTIRSFSELPITLGKNPGCNFVLDHPAISDYHVQIFFYRNQYWVKDLTGQKLVSINRQQINGEAALSPKDEVALSPGGPVLNFLGEGRLAEGGAIYQEERPKAGDQKIKTAPQPGAEKSSSEGFLSQFKKKLWG